MEHWKSLGLVVGVMGASLYAEENCDPCCTPEPKKCIDCVCYTAPFYELQCDWGVFLDAEFLYWYGRENNLITSVEYTTVVSGVDPSFIDEPGFVSCPTDYNFISSGWDPGVRIGAGVNSSCDGWDYTFYWTWYKNTKSTSNSVPNWNGVVPVLGGKMLISPWAPAAANIFGYNKAKADWKFTYNNFDLVMGRRYYLSQCFTLRPFAGLRGTWTETDFNTKYTRDLADIDDFTSSFNAEELEVDFNNEVWGVGFVGGIQPAFFFTPCFSLFGEVAASLVWGKHSYKSTEGRVAVAGDSEDDLFSLVAYTCTAGKNSPSWMQPQIDLALGLRWEDTYCCDRYSFGLDAGWEHHVLLSHNLRARQLEADFGGVATTTDEDAIIYSESVWGLSDVGFGGFVLRARFDF